MLKSVTLKEPLEYTLKDSKNDLCRHQDNDYLDKMKLNTFFRSIIESFWWIKEVYCIYDPYSGESNQISYIHNPLIYYSTPLGLFSIVIHLYNVLDWQESRTELGSHPALSIDLSPVQVETVDNISVGKLLRVMENIHSKKDLFRGGWPSHIGSWGLKCDSWVLFQ